MKLTPEGLIKKLEEAEDFEPDMFEPVVLSGKNYAAINIDDLYRLLFTANKLGLTKIKLRTARIEENGKVIFKVHPDE